MHTLARAIGTLSLVAAATTLGAQGPGRPPASGRRPGPGMMPGGPGGFGGPAGGGPIGATADFLLAHTGDLALTDAQVIRLAAISRRTDARRKTMMARMDSVRGSARTAPGDSAGGPGRGRRFAPPQADMQQMRDQMHTDIRDAIAVLTPDQQASAWMMVAARPALGGRPGGSMGPRFGRGPDGDRAQPSERGPISRPPAPRDVPRRPEGAANSQP
jgi:LTXXQ motif family protein